MAVAGAALLGALAAPAAAQPTAASYTQPYQRKAFEIYRTIVGMRTAAGQGMVPAMAEYLAGQFRAGGFPAADVHVLPLTRAVRREDGRPRGALPR